MTVEERVARFLRINYTPGTTDVPWDAQPPDERAAWLEEASHIVSLVRAAQDDAIRERAASRRNLPCGNGCVADSGGLVEVTADCPEHDRPDVRGGR